MYPAAGYVSQARDRGARVAVVNMDAGDTGSAGTLQSGDFLFQGDAAEILPEILRGVIGDLDRGVQSVEEPDKSVNSRNAAAKLAQSNF